MRTSIHVALAILLVAPLAAPSTARAQAQDAPHAAALRYADRDTHLFGWLEIGEVEFAELDGFMGRVTGAPPPDAQQLADRVKMARALQQSLAAAGAEWAYLLASLGELAQSEFLIVIPCEEPEVAKTVLDVWPRRVPLKTRIDDRVVLLGSETRLETATQHPGSASPRLQQAITAAADDAGPHGMAFAPPEGFRDVLKILTSPFEEEIPEPIKQLVDSVGTLRWAAVAGDLPPEGFTLTLHLAGPEAAEQMQQTVGKLFSTDEDRLPEGLAVRQEEETVVVSTDSQEATVAALQSFQQTVVGDGPPPQIANRMKQLALALHNYHGTYGRFPPQAVVDDQGNRLLSWRVLLLPYLQQQELYEQFRLDEPWDSAHNLALVEKIPGVYQALDEDELPAGHTRILAPLTPDTLLGRPGEPVGLQHVIDGTSNTIWLLQAPAEAAVPWSKPADWIVSENSYEELLPSEKTTVPVSFVDGSVRAITGALDDKTFRALLTISGREVIPSEKVR